MQAFIAVQTSPSTKTGGTPEVSRLIVLADSEAEALTAFHAYMEPNDVVSLVDEQPDPTWLSEQRSEKTLLPGKVQPYAAPLK